MSGDDVLAGEALTSDAITADFRILQRKRGHRYSLDDLAVAAEAVRACPRADAYVDLGCGIGSVLLMVSWKLRPGMARGIEALDISAALARRNVAENDLSATTTIIEGDLRDVTQDWPFARAELVTGTPPYLPVGSALASPDPQRAAARLELRGSVQDYLAAAARIVVDDGIIVVCAGGNDDARVLEGAAAAALAPLRRQEVYARTSAKTPLLSVWTLRPGHPTDDTEVSRLLIRNEDGEQTEAARAMRQVFGLP